MLLRKVGEREKSKDQLIQIVQTSKVAGKHFKTLNKEWITLAKKALSTET
jgi:hypothetical protein